MKTQSLKHILILLLGFIFLNFTIETENTKNILFKIERSKDLNTVYYKVNTDKYGNLIKNKPIEIFWIKYSEKARKEPLTWIQDNYSYGLKFLKIEKRSAKFQFVSYEKKNFNLRKDKNGKYKVYTLSKGKEVEVKRIYVHINGGTFWVPEISKVELHAKCSVSGSKSIEIIKP